MALTALIADDEDAPRALLVSSLKAEWPELRAIHECGNGVDAWDAFLEHGPQVCFLDVRMPGMTGIEAAQRIGGRAHIVFLCSSGDRALPAFEAGGVDVIVKPIDAERVAPVIARLRERISEPDSVPMDLHDSLAAVAGQVRRVEPIAVLEGFTGGDSSLVHLDDVVYFESEGRNTRAMLRDREVQVRIPLKELLARIDGERFCQIQRFVVVNRRQISDAARDESGALQLALRDRDERLPVARVFESQFGSLAR